jgi:hypothetical protein
MRHSFCMLTAFVVVSTVVIGKWISGDKQRINTEILPAMDVPASTEQVLQVKANIVMC